MAESILEWAIGGLLATMLIGVWVVLGLAIWLFVRELRDDY